MLILTRRTGQSVVLTIAGKRVVVKLANPRKRGSVCLAFTADRDVKIIRGEIENKERS